VPLDVAAEVISNVQLSSDYNVLALAAPEIARRALPGQFVMVKAGDRLEPLLRRPFSIFEVLRDGEQIVGLSLLSKRVGPSTTLLYDARPGDRIECLGPLGRPFAPVTAPDEAWLVAGGVGLAPFATLARELRARMIAVKLYYGARRAAELFYLDMFENLGVDLVLATEDGSRGEHGRVTVPLERDLKSRPSRASVMLYACGPEPMLAAVARLSATYGRPSQVSVERVMGCGVGGCYSCVIPIKTPEGKPHFVRACLAGPVFRGSEISW
jgi:dihydroorotate dehydrogenase electron transfer subunit